MAAPLVRFLFVPKRIMLLVSVMFIFEKMISCKIFPSLSNPTVNFSGFLGIAAFPLMNKSLLNLFGLLEHYLPWSMVSGQDGSVDGTLQQ